MRTPGATGGPGCPVDNPAIKTFIEFDILISHVAITYIYLNDVSDHITFSVFKVIRQLF